MAAYSVKAYRGKKVIINEGVESKSDAEALKKRMGIVKNVSKIEVVKN